MKTKQITTESGIVLLLVEVPEQTSEIAIDQKPNGTRLCFYHSNHGFHSNWDWMWLPKGNWQGKHFNEMSDGDYYMIVGRSFKNYQPKQQLNQQSQYDMFWVKCPNGKEEHFESKEDSFSYAVKMELVYILHSHGFDPETTVVLQLNK